MAEQGRRRLADLPKAHLHLHMEAALTPASFRRLGQRCGVQVPCLDAAPGDGSGFAAFAETFLGLIAVLRTPGAFDVFFDELATDAVADGAVFIELAVSPEFYVPPFADADAALRAMLAAAAAASRARGIEISLMVTVDRTGSSQDACRTAQLAARYAGAGVSALGLANDEVANPASRFTQAFDIARSAGLRATPHAGELLGPESVTAALDQLGACRIQHGVRAAEDPRLLERLAAAGTPLDVCPTSNVRLGVVDELGRHPLPDLLAAGVTCTINADDPTIFGSGLLAEYQLCREVLHLDDAALAACARASLQHSAASPDLKRRALEGVQAWLTAGSVHPLDQEGGTR